MTANDPFTIVQPQNTLCLPQFRLKLFRRSYIPANPSFRGYTSTRVFHGDREEPSRTCIRSGAYSFRRNLLHLYLSKTNAPSQVNQKTTFFAYLLPNDHSMKKTVGGYLPEVS